MEIVLSILYLVQQLNALLGLVKLMVLVTLNYSQHLHLLVILTDLHSDLLDLEIYSLLVDLLSLLQPILQSVPFCLLDLVMQLKDRLMITLVLEISLLLVESQKQLRLMRQQQVSLQYLVMVLRNRQTDILVLQLLSHYLVLQLREQLKTTLEILLSILYLELLLRDRPMIMSDLVLYSQRVDLLRLSQVILQKILHSLLSVEVRQSPLLQQQRLDLVLYSPLVDLERASQSTKQRLVFIQSVVKLYSITSSVMLVLDLYSLLEEQQNPRLQMYQKIQFCLLQLVLLQTLLQLLQIFLVELYLHSLVRLLSKELQLQRKQLDYTQLVVQSSLSTESDTLVLETSLLQAVQRKQLVL